MAAGERALGRDHPSVLVWQNNLTTLLHYSGRFAEAEALLRETVATGERVLGREHPDVLVWRDNLADLLRAPQAVLPRSPQKSPSGRGSG